MLSLIMQDFSATLMFRMCQATPLTLFHPSYVIGLCLSDWLAAAQRCFTCPCVQQTCRWVVYTNRVIDRGSSSYFSIRRSFMLPVLQKGERRWIHVTLTN